MNNRNTDHSLKRMMSGLSSRAVIACVAFGAATAFAQTSYTVTDLGVLPGKEESVPAAINDNGQVAGTSNAESSSEAAFRYNPNNKSIEDLGRNLAASSNRAFGMNNAGTVVGDSAFFATAQSDAIRHAALFFKGAVSDLGVLKGQIFSRANGINSLNQVVGFSGPALDSEKSRAFFWSPSTGMRDLGTLGGSFAQAYAINDAGSITGNSQTASGSTFAAGVHAFLYQPAAKVNPMRDLGTLGGSFSYGMSINDKNHVVGYSTINSVDSRVHAFLFDGKMMRDLGTLASGPGNLMDDQSVALGINNGDQVVGYTYVAGRPINPNIDPPVPTTTPGQQVAFIWSKGAMTDLNKLIGAAAKDYHLDSAVAINDKGQIVVSARSIEKGTTRALLLTPVSTSTPPIPVKKK